jgi:hypothetical protein
LQRVPGRVAGVPTVDAMIGRDHYAERRPGADHAGIEPHGDLVGFPAEGIRSG